MTTGTQAAPYRLTQYARGGGCACKIPPGELEQMVAGLLAAMAGSADAVVPGPAGAGLPGPAGVGVAGPAGAGVGLVGPAGGLVGPAGAGVGLVGPAAALPGQAGELLVGLDDGDDAAVVRLSDDLAVVATTDFFTPVVDDPYDWGRIAAANALSDVYAMGGRPVVAVNVLCWPRGVLPLSLAAEVLRGGLDVTALAACHLAGGHSVDDAEPKYGMAVTGVLDPARIMRNDAGRAGLPLSLTKPLGVGVLNSRHKATGEVFRHAIECMATLNALAASAALAAGVACATDVTGFGLLGHLHKLARASGVTAVIDAAAVPYLDGARTAAADGFVSGGTRRNLEWVAPHVDLGPIDETEALLLADAQTSGGLLLAGEIPGAPIIGELVPATQHTVQVR